MSLKPRLASARSRWRRRRAARLREAKRTNALGITKDNHVPHRVQIDDVVCAVEFLTEMTEDFNKIGPVVVAMLMRDVVHDHLGVVSRVR